MRILLLRTIGSLLIAVLVTANLSTKSAAKDLELLTRLLIPAFLAQNFTLLCANQDPEFLAGQDIGVSTVNTFSEHVKKETTIDLSEDEASEIQIRAANTARYESLKELKRIKGQQAEVPPDVLRNWCDNSAKPFILGIIDLHEKRHAEFDSKVTAAKR